jgi:hypothetical protein
MITENNKIVKDVGAPEYSFSLGEYCSTVTDKEFNKEFAQQSLNKYDMAASKTIMSKGIGCYSCNPI